MRILYVVEWRYEDGWELGAAFVEPKDAVQYSTQLQLEFSADNIRIVKKKVSFNEMSDQ
jgi:hypothetical protein